MTVMIMTIIMIQIPLIRLTTPLTLITAKALIMEIPTTVVTVTILMTTVTAVTMVLIMARKMRFLFANAAKCEPDKQGRFLIPAELRQYAGLSSEVTFIGQGGHAEIWDSAAYDELEQQTLTPENLAAVMEELGF